jgi:hypothetical protein
MDKAGTVIEVELTAVDQVEQLAKLGKTAPSFEPRAVAL